MIFIARSGGIGRSKGPIVGTIVFFALRQTPADLGTIYRPVLGAGESWSCCRRQKALGLVVAYFGWQVFPLERSVILGDRRTVTVQKSGG